MMIQYGSELDARWTSLDGDLSIHVCPRCGSQNTGQDAHIYENIPENAHLSYHCHDCGLDETFDGPMEDPRMEAVYEQMADAHYDAQEGKELAARMGLTDDYSPFGTYEACATCFLSLFCGAHGLGVFECTVCEQWWSVGCPPSEWSADDHEDTWLVRDPSIPEPASVTSCPRCAPDVFPKEHGWHAIAGVLND